MSPQSSSSSSTRSGIARLVSGLGDVKFELEDSTTKVLGDDLMGVEMTLGLPFRDLLNDGDRRGVEAGSD